VALLVCLLLAQVATILHAGDHENASQQSTCTLCAAAGHLSAPPLVTFVYEASDFCAPAVPTRVQRPVFGLFVCPYQSRAPPHDA
jgi:hypothetical protein